MPTRTPAQFGAEVQSAAGDIFKGQRARQQLNQFTGQIVKMGQDRLLRGIERSKLQQTAGIAKQKTASTEGIAQANIAGRKEVAGIGATSSKLDAEIRQLEGALDRASREKIAGQQIAGRAAIAAKPKPGAVKIPPGVNTLEDFEELARRRAEREDPVPGGLITILDPAERARRQTDVNERAPLILQELLKEFPYWDTNTQKMVFPSGDGKVESKTIDDKVKDLFK